MEINGYTIRDDIGNADHFTVHLSPDHTEPVGYTWEATDDVWFARNDHGRQLDGSWSGPAPAIKALIANYEENQS